MAAWKKLDDMQVLSKDLPRVDAPDKVSGRAKYTHDVRLPGMLYAALLTSPHPAAKVISIDASAVQKLPGVRAVLTDAHPTGTVRFAGEYVAAVAATSPEIARDALDLFVVHYEERSFVVSTDAALQEGAPRVFADRENEQEARVREEGDVEAAFAAAHVVVEGAYRTQVQTHSPLETHGSVAQWDGDRLTVWDSTQAVHGVREGIAGMLEIPADKVRVICEHMGGGFGAKLQPGLYSVLAARLAKQAGAPVQLMLSRRDEHLSVGNRPDSIQQVRAGASADGKLIAFDAKTWGTSGISGGAGVSLPYVYAVPNWRTAHSDVLTNGGGGRAFRAPGRPQAAFSMEQVMDELAEKLGLDPLEFRLRNDPNETRQQQWALGAERFGWSARQPANSDTGPIKRGMGLGASIWFTGGRGTQVQMSVHGDGAVAVRCGTQDIGTGTRTYVAAIAAEELGLPVERITPLIGDSEYPYSGGSGGSTTVPSVAPAVKNAAEKTRAKLAERAVGLLGGGVDDVVFAAGRVRCNGQSIAFEELCAALGTEVLTVHGEWVEGLSGSGVAGCQFVEVEVDTYTGRIEVLRVLSVSDCGLILDRLTTRSQINGAIIQGVSYALFEERMMDAVTGTMVNAEFENYKIAGALETPDIDIVLFDQPERGVIGIGEPPTIPTSAAIANAVYNAIGVRMRQLPMTPDRVLNALQEV